jgi:hypothetical protein
VDHPIAGVIQIELFRRSTDVTIVVPVPFKTAINSGDENVASDVELSPVDQETVFQIFLDNHASLAVLNTLHQLFLQLGTVGVHSDTKTAIRVFARLYNPHVMRRCDLL